MRWHEAAESQVLQKMSVNKKPAHKSDILLTLCAGLCDNKLARGECQRMFHIWMPGIRYFIHSVSPAESSAGNYPAAFFVAGNPIFADGGHAIIK